MRWVRAVIYARVSRAADRSSETSTPRQIANCRSYLSSREWDEHAVFRDVDRSAYRSGVLRPGFEAMLAELTRGGVDVLVVWKLDRLTRRSRDFERVWSVCEDHRVALASVTEPVDTTTPIGLAIVRVLLTFASVESTVKGERLAARFREKATRGLPHEGGVRPFGHSRDRSEVIEGEAVLLREAAQRIIHGEGVVAIARDFRARGVVGSCGVPWTHTGMRSSLLSARMVGDRSYRGDVVARDCFPAILDRNTHELVRHILDDTPKRARPSRSLLQGLLRCGLCGQHLTAAMSSKKSLIYKCAGSPYGQGCDRISISRPLVEDLLVRAVRDRLRRRSMRRQRAEPSDPTGRLRELNRAYFVAGALSRAEFYATRQTLLSDDDDRADRWNIHPDIPPGASGRELDRRWDELTRSAQRALLEAFLDRAVVAPAPVRGGGFQPERVHLHWHGT